MEICRAHMNTAPQYKQCTDFGMSISKNYGSGLIDIRPLARTNRLFSFLPWLLLVFLVGCNSPSPVSRGDARSMLANASASIVAVGYKGSTIGTAFSLGGNHFATSNHIATKSPIYLLDSQGNPVTAKRVAQDNKRDIAILHSPLLAPSLSIADNANVGTTIYALGNPFGIGLTATRGIISATPQSIRKPDLLQIDAAVNPGNSGGPIVNAAGQAMGLVSSRAAVGSGIAFAVPIQSVLNLLRSIHSRQTAPPQ